MAIPLAVPLVGAALSIGTSIWGASKANKAQKKAAKKEKEARDEMNRLKNIYANLDTSNPFLNMDRTMNNLTNVYSGMENTMEDLTVNQQQARFEADQFQRSQANILSGLRGSTGGSGIAALAQSLSQQGQIAAQRSSASIGQQEARNQMARAQEAGRLQMQEASAADRNQMAIAQQEAQLQMQERQGEVYSRNLEREKYSTLLGMAQEETAAYGAQAGMAEKAKWDAISGGVTGAFDMIAGFGGGAGTNV
jgi:hypothetical protein|tara:strand:+ start:237 stop:989 length:753 start_codon:yes stop_codon:yes gene_type:complete